MSTTTQLPRALVLAMWGLFVTELAVIRGSAAVEDSLASEAWSIVELRCFECHSHTAKKLKAGLFLDSRSGVLQGGDSGPAVEPGNPGSSLLIKAVRYEAVDLQMPPKSKLPDEEIALLEEWVRRGAHWLGKGLADAPNGSTHDAFDLKKRRDEHWAWQPIKPTNPPAINGTEWPAQPVDRFILARLNEAGLQPAPEADRRTLFRRLYFVLTGLPPTPEAVAAFEQNDSPQAFADAVQTLLDSPRFGERWARHWLDVVRYSETLGHEFDYALPNAWRYRDYAIRAFNADVRYDQFVREHIAGDLMKDPRRDPATGLNESAIATGFFWFGQQVHSPVDIKGNQLDVIDNQIDTLTRGFQALTVSCARCHDHKFDAISTKDFYALYGALASSRYTQIDVSDRQANEEKLKAVAKLRGKLRRELKVAPLAAASAPAFADWQFEGMAMRDPVVPVDDVLFRQATNPVVKTRGPLISSRKLSVRLEGAARSPNFVIERRYLHVLAAGRGSRAKLVLENFQMIQNPIYGGLKRALDSDELKWITFDLEMWRGRRAYLELIDTATPDLAGMAADGVRANGWFDLAEVIWSDQANPPERGEAFEAIEVTDTAEELLAELDATSAGLVEPARAPGLIDSEGIDQPVLTRGGPGKPGEPVQRRYLEALGGLEHPVENGSGREKIADLIASPDNPLTARVWVNRVWHHLFGRGLVATVDDFGVLGEKPSHPELLDWLAHWFVTEGEWSTKKLITLLVTSGTWRQSALAAEAGSDGLRHGKPGSSAFDQIDPDNVLLHKWTVRRLEGEAIRDTILAVSGRLDLDPPQESIATHLTSFMTGRGRPGESGPLDGDGKRSIYLEVRRNFMSPMMLAFDTPQAAQTFGRRARSNVPAQALILMNDPFVQQQSKLFARRMAVATPDESVERRVCWLYEQALQREPTTEELNAAVEFLAARTSEPSAETWADLCHVLFNVKEFVFVN